MSKGSPIVPIRIDPGMLHLLDCEIRKVNERRREAEYTRSSFIIAAIRDKLNHLFRSRVLSRKKRKCLTSNKPSP